MKIQTPPGMRDFYPEDMRLHNWLLDHWRQVSLAFGFQEYEGPIFEFLELYTVKSGEGIVSELFNFEDRGERRFAIRPEMTPTLARMVAARANALPRPIKWFSMPRMCRAEKPQRGRLREFFQWNVDTLGPELPLADAELAAVAVEFFRRVGLSAQDVALHVSSRRLAAAMLRTLSVSPDQEPRAFVLLDRIEKLPPDEFDRQWREAFPAAAGPDALREVLRLDAPACLAHARQQGAEGEAAAVEFEQFWMHLGQLGAADFARFDLTVVRGLGYYTGIVFEAYMRSGSLRALLGGGRYDDLTSMLGGPRVSGAGFGMGDAPIIEALRELGKLPEQHRCIDAFVIDAQEELFVEALALVSRLRSFNISTDYSFQRQPLGKQLKQASARGARFAVVVGPALGEQRSVSVKDLASGTQEEIAEEALVEWIVTHRASAAVDRSAAP